MDSKKLTYSKTIIAFLGLLAVVFLIIGGLINALWNKYNSSCFETAKAQIEIHNNYILSKYPNDSTDLNYVHYTLFKDNNSPIENFFFKIYDENNNLLYSNATSTINYDVPTFEEIKHRFSYEIDKISIHHPFYDSFLEMDCLYSATYSKSSRKYIVSESTIINEANISDFVSSAYIKLTLIILMTIIAVICITLLYIHINNIERLKKFILKLNNDYNSSTTNQEQLNDKGITDDLYTLYKKQLEIIKKHDKEREQAIQEEKERLLSKRTLANNLNHEIKTPIGIIMGYLDTLINHPDIDKKTQLTFLNKCLQNTKRLQNMVINIAVINRLEDGKNNIALEDVNVRQIVLQAKEDLKFTLEEYNMSLQIFVNPDIYVKSNEMLLYNIFCNLIKNSCFYSNGTDIVIKYHSKEGNYLRFSFFDNGTGVPVESTPKLFNRFYRVEKDKNKKNGTGLGLAIVKESIDLCNGTIMASNRIEGGLEFIFTLPSA